MNTIAPSGSAPREPDAPHSYTAPWGRALRWTSLLATTVCAGMVIAGSVFQARLPCSSWTGALPISLPLVIIACALPFTIRGYTVTRDDLVIQRLWWRNHLPLHGLTGCEAVPRAMKRSLRTCGNGGLFSFTGWYWNRSLGHFRAFVTDLERTVVLRFGKRTILVSPDQPEEFAAALRRMKGNRAPP